MPRKRTKYTISIEQMKAVREIKERMSLERIFNETNIFHEAINDSPLDENTVLKIKGSFKVWFESWIKPQLDKL